MSSFGGTVQNPAFAPPLNEPSPYTQVTAAEAVYNSPTSPRAPSLTRGGFTVPIAENESSTDGPQQYENQTIGRGSVYENQDDVSIAVVVFSPHVIYSRNDRGFPVQHSMHQMWLPICCLLLI